ncbi:hypothetical protein [Paraburkholderia sp. J12]|uniref:hypothetical protein n=1 Tax=Paraburkholderia sp. J12 TaxID=2805432 RepID=UPI002ABE77D1|nr:hypothetical protein [Paraburkholderia sp. J12]
METAAHPALAKRWKSLREWPGKLPQKSQRLETILEVPYGANQIRIKEQSFTRSKKHRITVLTLAIDSQPLTIEIDDLIADFLAMHMNALSLADRPGRCSPFERHR